MKEGGFLPESSPDKKGRRSLESEEEAKPEVKRMSRRDFIGSAAAAGLTASYLVPEAARGLADAFFPESEEKRMERERAIAARIVAAQEKLKRPDVLAALEGKGESPYLKVLEAAELPILPEHLSDTSYDVREPHRYPSIDRKNNRLANVVHWEREDVVLAAAHHLHGDSKERDRYPVPGIDMDAFRVPSGVLNYKLLAKNPEEIVKDDPTLTNAAIHGQFVVVVGIDKDERGGEDRKTYPGIALKVTPGLAHAMYPKSHPEIVQFVGNSFMLILPPGEARPHDADPLNLEVGSRDKKPPRAAGMSGSPMFVHRDGAHSFAGLLWGVMPIRDVRRQRTIDVGFVHGIDEVRRVVRARARRLNR